MRWYHIVSLPIFFLDVVIDYLIDTAKSGREGMSS
jgi:hypothetical protein